MRNEIKQFENDNFIIIKPISKKDNARNLIRLMIYGFLCGICSIFFMYAILYLSLEYNNFLLK